MLSSSLSASGVFGTRVSHRFRPTRTSPPTLSLPPPFTHLRTASGVFGWMPSSIMRPMPSRSLYSENGVTARSRGHTSFATSLASLMRRTLRLNSLAMRMSEPSVPPAQSESQGVICELRLSNRQRIASRSCWLWLYSMRAVFCSGVSVSALVRTVLSLCVPFLRYAASMTSVLKPSFCAMPSSSAPVCPPMPLKSWLWM
mmetsp:Transcript_39825/g.103790  ORF Transcript_39825/g.103790 Transcript_39825/m.103790 type:complete len:200 (+) Transcript_39825:919-1518(+)